nr:hypothetical protein [Tanacetum cinerariifolium]
FTTRHDRGALSWYKLSATCHTKDCGPSRGLYLCQIALSLFVGDDDESDDDDACVKILLVTPLHFAIVTPSLGNQGGSSAAPTAEDSRGKGVMVDEAAASFIGVDAPYRPTFGVLTKEVFKDPTICKTIVDQFPTPGEMEVFKDPTICKTIVDQFPTPGEMMVNAEVDGSDPKMTDDIATVKSGHAFVQGIFVALDDAVELVEVGSGRVFSSPNDVVVAFSAHGKGDSLNPSSAA